MAEPDTAGLSPLVYASDPGTGHRALSALHPSHTKESGTASAETLSLRTGTCLYNYAPGAAEYRLFPLCGPDGDRGDLLTAAFVPQARYMMRALDLARQAAEMGEVPVGAVVVQKSSGRIIGEGYNRRETDRSPLAHAEIMAIDAASRNLGGWRLLDSALYVTLDPCPMCAGAILHARLDQVIYGASDPKGGAVDSVEQLFALPYNWTPEVHAGLLQAECAQVLKNFFRELRMKKQAEKNARKSP